MSTSEAAKKAKNIMTSLDKASDYLKIYRDASKGNEDTLEKLDEHDKQLASTRDVLSKISFEDRYQTPRVESELPSVGEIVENLVKDLGKGKPPSLRKVNNDILDLGKATKNLRQLLPGMYIVAEEHVQEANGLFQSNGPVARFLPEQLDGLTSISRRNQNKGEIQINSVFSGDGEALIREATKHRERIAQLEMQKRTSGERKH